MRMIFCFLFLFTISANAYLHELAPQTHLNLDPKKWVHGKGNFTGTVAGQMTLYSHKKQKDFQIVYEDLLLAEKKVQQRLPKECVKSFPSQFSASQYICQYRTTEAGPSKTSLTVISFFKTSEPDVLRVRSTYVIGESKSVAEMDKNMKPLLRKFKNLNGNLK